MAGFDPDAYLAENAPRASAPVVPDEILPPAKPSARRATVAEIGRAPTAAAETLFNPDDYLATGGAEDYDPAEAFGRGALQGITLGFSDELAGLVDAGFTAKTYAQGRDESRRANRDASKQNPFAYGAGEIAGSVAIPGLGVGGAAGKLGLRGAGAIAAAGAVEGAVQGVGMADGGVSESIRGALIGGLTGGVAAGVAGKAFGAYAGAAERRAVRDTTKSLAEGAIPTQQRRFAEIKDLAFEELTPDKEFMRATSKPEAAAEIARARLAKFGPETDPIYTRLDTDVGKVPIAKVTGKLDEMVGKAAQDFGDDGTDLVLAEVRDRFVAKARAKYGDDVTEVPHKEVRRWVTGLLKHKTRVMGSISETEQADFAHAAFKAADDILKGHLDEVRKLRPDLAPDLEKLTGLNRKIRAWASVEALMEHKAGREFWKKDGSRFASGLSSVAGIGGMAATGSVVGAAAALLPPGMRGLFGAVKAGNRKATMWLARLERAARAGNVSKRMVLDAVKAGVPLAVAQAAASGARAGQRLLPEGEGE